MAVEKSVKDRTKVVLRHIPPGFTSDSLLELLSNTLTPFPEYDFYHFSSPDYSLVPYLSCRAYFNFLDAESAICFKDRFDSQKFVDSNKVQSIGIVEYAPFQRIPKRFKKDVRAGTIEKDPDFLEFLKDLQLEPDAPPSMETIIDEIEKNRAAKAEQQSSTALLDYIKTRRADRSLSPNTKPHYSSRRDRGSKSDDRDSHRDKGNRNRGRLPSEEAEGYDNSYETSRGEEFRSRNSVRHDRQPKHPSKSGKPEKAIYVPGKRKNEESAKFILSSRDDERPPREPKEDKSSEERHSYRRDNYEDKKDKNSGGEHEDKADTRKDYRREDRDRNGRGDREYRRDSNEGRGRRQGDKDYRREDRYEGRDKDYEREEYFERKGRGGYRGGYRGGGWRDDRPRGRGRGRGRGSYRGNTDR